MAGGRRCTRLFTAQHSSQNGTERGSALVSPRPTDAAGVPSARFRAFGRAALVAQAESVEVFRAVMKDDATQASASVVVGGTAVRTRSADVVSTQRRTAGQAIFKDLTLGEHFRLSPSFPDRRVGLHEDAS